MYKLDMLIQNTKIKRTYDKYVTFVNQNGLKYTIKKMKQSKRGKQRKKTANYLFNEEVSKVFIK